MHGSLRRVSLSGALLTPLAVVLAAVQPASARTVTVGGASGQPGWVVDVPVTLSDSSGTAGTQNDISYDGVVLRIRAKADGSPDCAVNPALGKSGYFEFHPFGCVADDCYAARAIIVSTSNITTIPDGDLYTCQVRIAPGAAPVHTCCTTRG